LAGIMASINIPDEALPDLKKIAQTTEEVFNSLISAITETTPTLRPIQFEKEIAAKVKSISSEELRSILGTTFFLYRLKEKADVSPKEFSEAVSNSTAVSQSDDLSLEQKDGLKKRLELLLGLDKPLGVTAKALDVMTHHENIFYSARIFSDIRPVFSEKPATVSAAVIIHNLQIGFGHSGSRQEIYFALDTNDIQELKEVIERAEQKTIALKSIIAKADVPYLDV
jgi:hypothetical protein